MQEKKSELWADTWNKNTWNENVTTVSRVSICVLDGSPYLVAYVQRLVVLHLLSVGLDFGEYMGTCERGQKRKEIV